MTSHSTEHSSEHSSGYSTEYSAGNRYIAPLLALALVIIPLPKGGMIPGAALFFGCLVMLAFGFHLFSASSHQQEIKKMPWIIVFMVLTLWIIAQLKVFPYLFDWGDYFPGQLDKNEFKTLLKQGPINLLESLNYWSLFVAYWVFAYLVSTLSRHKINWLLGALVASFGFQIIYGLLAKIDGYETFLGIWPRVHYLGSATGSFVNHNHYASFLALCWPLFLSFFLKEPNRHEDSPFPASVKWTVIPLTSMFCLVALIMSTSRMGLAAGLVGLSIWIWLYTGRNKGDGIARKTRLAILFSIWFSLILVALWYGIDEVITRFQRLSIVEGRWEIWSNILTFSKTAWLYGVGAGAFSDAYLLHNSPTAIMIAQEAHNDYLQFFLEMGLIGGGLIVLALLYWMIKVYPRGSSVLKLGAITAIMVVALHSLVDFSLQIPGVAAFFWLSVGLVMNPNLSK